MIVNLLTISAWLAVLLWCAAYFWTRYCLKKQSSLAPEKSGKIQSAPPVSILVPARNEARRVLQKSLSSMLNQDYENFELIVVDDRSTDATPEILERFKIQNPKLKILNGEELKQGWLGKPHALEQAFEKSCGEWILATDADIIFAPETLQTAVAYAEKNGFDALTLIPEQILGSFWERLFMPVFAWFCLLAMPLHRVNNRSRRESLGVGNFFMLRRGVLEKIGGFQCVKNEVAEDLKLAEILKSRKFNLRVDFAPGLIETRMYYGFREIWEGFTKNLFSGMKFSTAKTIFAALSIFLYGFLPVIAAFVCLFSGSLALFVPLFAVYILQVSVFISIQRAWHGNLFFAPLAPLGLLMFLAILTNSAIKITSGRGVAWKGRAVYEKGGIRPPVKENLVTDKRA